jgi:predicted transposase/invertase (TIGR01784 family)
MLDKNTHENNLNHKLSPHDRFTRSAMTHTKVAKEFFQQNLPAHIKNVIDFSSIKVEKESFIDDKLKLQIADLLFSANFNEQPGFLYILFEHASSSKALLPFRMLKYMVAIMDHHLESAKDKKNAKLPLVYPIILYNGKKPYRHSMDVFDLFHDAEKELAKLTLLSPYHLIDLTQVSDDNLREFFYYGVMARTLKHIYDLNILPFIKEDLIYALKELEKRGEERYIYSVITYIGTRGETLRQEGLIETLKELESINEEGLMTLVEYLKPAVFQRGVEKGIEQGIEKGIEKGIEQGIEQGREEEKIEIARAFLAQGVSIETIAKATSLPKRTIKKLLS